METVTGVEKEQRRYTLEDGWEPSAVGPGEASREGRTELGDSGLVGGEVE